MFTERPLATPDDDALLDACTRIGKEVWIRTENGAAVLCGVLSESDYRALLAKARARGWPLA